ncbi:MAG: PhnD/SsuA/transferrin family substrate-binding protein [Gammaproteobacteria bacterium]|nr:PhnD/SsuA/transferrin family substrate-binding protein [Gammaproteobacteria bacterium]
MIARLALTLTLLISGSMLCQAAEYKLAIQPILPEKELIEIYQPLADYLSKATGQTISISTERNFTFYWHKMYQKRGGYDLVLDAAHFTDYRIQQQGYQAIVKMPDTVSFSIVTHEDNFVLDIKELTNKRIATMPSPSLGAMRLEKLFPNPVRIPLYTYERNANKAVESVLSGKVDAAIIPTPLASQYTNLNTVMTTEPVPHMALSASPEVPADIVEKIRTALIEAPTTADGKTLLARLKLEKFEATDNATYAGYAKLLEGIYGYDQH